MNVSFRSLQNTSGGFNGFRIFGSLGLLLFDREFDALRRNKIPALVQIEIRIESRDSQLVRLTPVYDAAFGARHARRFEHSRDLANGERVAFVAFGNFLKVAEAF